MAGSTTQNTSVLGPRLPYFAASDIFAGTLVKLAAPGATGSSVGTGWAVQMVASSNDRPVGVARADTVAGIAVSVFAGANDQIPRIVAGGSVAPGDEINIVGTSSAAHPLSNVVNSYPVAGKVSGASGTAVWSIGTSLEQANPGETFAFLLHPRQLSFQTGSF